MEHQYRIREHVLSDGTSVFLPQWRRVFDSGIIGNWIGLSCDGTTMKDAVASIEWHIDDQRSPTGVVDVVDHPYPPEA